MDPATAGGLGLGVISLMFDVFDNSVKLFKFFSAMVDMPEEHEQFRLRLMIEYNRLLAWGEAVGLIDVPEGSNVAMKLGTNALELCSIVSRIGWLLGEFRDINARWKNELNPYQEHDQTEMDERAMDAVKKISSLALAYDKAKEERQHLLGTNHILRWIQKGAKSAKDIAAHPSRIRWVMIDKVAFEALLQDLHVLIERIHELMDAYRAKEIGDITAKAYLELVVMRNDVKELRAMVEAVTSLIEASQAATNTSLSQQKENEEILRDLLRLKEINHISDQMLTMSRNEGFDIEKDFSSLITVTRYDAISIGNHLSYGAVEGVRDPSKLDRPRGVLTEGGSEIEVWIEWRSMDNSTEGSIQSQESRLRILTLAQMLHNRQPRHLYSPQCIGYIDDCKRNGRYGWIFKMPDGSNTGTTLKSLHTILSEAVFKPTLAQRISLAWRLATSLLYLHTTNWLHKGIHSGNILFPLSEGVFDVEAPILSGFEFARPQSNRTTSRSLDPRWDIYRWPGIQNDVPKATNSRKTYDIYSLGLVLLEIAHWRPLHKIMCLKRWPEPSSQDARIRAWLLEEERFPPFKDSNPLPELRSTTGEKYWKAVRHCLVAHDTAGMRIPEDSDQSQSSEVGLELQKAFTELVVEELKSILV